MSAPAQRGGVTRKENYKRLDSCTADLHDFRAPPPVAGEKNWATCRWCQGTASREAASLYLLGIRTGMLRAVTLVQGEWADIHAEQQDALIDPDAKCEGAECER